MTIAIFGLVGVIVGAIVTGTVDLFIAWRRKKATVFLAKRLVSDELVTIWVHVDGLIASRRTPQRESPEARVRFMPTSAWETHKETLAQKGVLTDDAWIGLSAALHSVETLRLFLLEEPPNSPLSPDIRQKAVEQREVVAANYESLTGRDIDMEPSG
jgi:hypothetical protein